ncbi:unnamed protein product [Leptosia nina]|uniref:L-type lectin-like domain-containing protein n=1 Tax=Leptosia nina TaxID=320188 RepID=A0AAV1JHY5_9NEOP
MVSFSINLLLCSVLCILVNTSIQQTVHRRFEYKYSFKPPYLAQKDGSVPFWEYGGNAIASGESVRLAPSLRSQKGAIWSKQPINFDWWEVDVMFKITGRGRIGADGLAFWYTSQRGDYTGDVFGSSDRWNGLGLIFDSFDNDNKHNNPYIMAVINDGTKNFDHKSDGSTQLLSGCLRDFRNKPFPTRARIEYYLNTLTVYFHNGLTNNEADYELCFRAENVMLPRGGFFGLSAATGGLADDHDVIHFLTSSLYSAQQPGSQQISNDEQQKLSQEYQEYQKKLEQQKEEYRKEHPDEMRDKDEMDDWFESDGQRELRQIFQSLSHIQDVTRELHKKVDEVIGKQMNSLSMLSAVYSQSQGQPIQTQPGQPIQAPQFPITRHDWEVFTSNNQLLIQTISEVKSFVIEANRKSDALLAGGAGAAAGAAGGAAINPQFLNELRDSVNQVKSNLAGVSQRLSSPAQPMQGGCPSVSCVSTGMLLLVLSGQLLVLFLYQLYKERKEAQAKKFF